KFGGQAAATSNLAARVASARRAARGPLGFSHPQAKRRPQSWWLHPSQPPTLLLLLLLLLLLRHLAATAGANIRPSATTVRRVRLGATPAGAVPSVQTSPAATTVSSANRAVIAPIAIRICAPNTSGAGGSSARPSPIQIRRSLSL